MDKKPEEKYWGAWVLVGLIGLAVFVWLGFYVHESGFRLTSFLPPGFWGLTSHQWGIIGSGTVGALLGGLLTVAGVVLTLKHQNKIHEATIDEGRRNEARRNALSAAQTFVLEVVNILSLDTGAKSQDTFLYTRALLATSQIEVEKGHHELGRDLRDLLSWYRRCMYYIARVLAIEYQGGYPVHVVPNLQNRQHVYATLVKEMEPIKRDIRWKSQEVVTAWFQAESHEERSQQLDVIQGLRDRLIEFANEASLIGEK